MEQTCKNCQYFVQHYIKHKHGYGISSGGHCFHPRIKLRFSTTPACQQFKARQEEA